MELEVVKMLGTTAGIVIIGVILIREVFKMLGKPKNTSGARLAGEVPTEYYDRRFDKIDTALAGIVSILQQQTNIMQSIRDMVIRQEGRDERFGDS